MRTDHLGQCGRRSQSQRFVSDRDGTIEVAGGGVSDGEYIERVGILAQRQRNRAIRQLHGFRRIPDRGFRGGGKHGRET